MKQPILFQSRAVDLSVLVSYLDDGVLNEIDGIPCGTDAQYFQLYLYACSPANLQEIQQIMQHEFQIDLDGLTYKPLNVPVVLDCGTGETFQVRSVDYSPSRQAIMNVLVEDGEDLRYIYNKEVYVPEGRYGAALKILNDGWN